MYFAKAGALKRIRERRSGHGEGANGDGSAAGRVPADEGRSGDEGQEEGASAAVTKAAAKASRRRRKAKRSRSSAATR